MRWLNPSATLNFRKPSMAFDMESVNFLFDELRVLRFIEKSSVYEKISTAVRRVNEKPEYIVLWFSLSSGEWIRTTDLRVMSQNPESVPFVRRALQIRKPDERWFKLAGHATVVNRYSYSSFFMGVRQVPFFYLSITVTTCNVSKYRKY